MYMSTSQDTRAFLKLIQDMHLIFANRSFEPLSIYIDQVYLETFIELESILIEEVNQNRLKPEATNFAKSISATADGMLLYSFMIDEFDLTKELTNYIHTLSKALLLEKTG